MCSLFSAYFTANAQDSARRPNIVVILADDLGYGDLACYGAKDIKTPNLDRMAREGTKFTSFCVAQAVCTPSRAALLTGCYPNRIGLEGALNHTSMVGIHPRETLVSSILKLRGYATAIFGKWHLGHQPIFLPTRHGFDQFAGLPYSNDNGPLHPTVRGIPPLPWYENEKVVAHDPDQSQFTRTITDRAVEFIKTNKDRPFFLYLPHVMPHVPIFASEKFKGTSQRGLYGDVVQELDWGVGKVLDALKEAGVDDQTLVIFFSDNGPFLSYGSHAGLAGILREGKLTAFDGGLRVPCLMRWPGQIPAGRVCDDLMTSIDLLPTIVNLSLGEDVKHKVDGQNLAPLVRGEPNAKGRDVFYCYAGNELHGVRKGRWKLHVPHEYLTVAADPGRDGKPSNFAQMKPRAIEESGMRGIASRHGYRIEKIGLSLFDMTTDPGERQNVADANPQIVRELLTLIESAREDLGDSLTNRPGANRRPIGDARKSP